MSTATMHRFAPISLGEINTSAALMRRVDRKYTLRKVEAATRPRRVAGHHAGADN